MQSRRNEAALVSPGATPPGAGAFLSHLNGDWIVTPFMQIVWTVLNGAKDAGDQIVIAACRRLIWANTRGFRRHAQAADIALIHEFAQ